MFKSSSSFFAISLNSGRVFCVRLWLAMAWSSALVSLSASSAVKIL